MNWPAVFLGCFVLGFALSVLSLALSPLRVHLHLHLPFGHHGPHLHMPVPHGGGAHGESGVSPINFATLMAFLAWFGGTGYLLTSQFRWLAMPALVLAMLAGVAGAFAVFWVMAPCPVVAAREHAERRLPDGRRARPRRPFDPRRGHRRADLRARRHAAFLRGQKRRWPRDRQRGGSGRDGLRPRHRLRPALGRVRGG